MSRLPIECRNLGKSFRAWKRRNGARRGLLGLLDLRVEQVKAVQGATFEVRYGEIFGLLGSNGSGKSTLIRMICTLLLPDEGGARVFGHDVVAEPAPVRRLIHRVSVEAALFRKLSPWENLSSAARWHGLSPNETRRRLGELAEQLRLPDEKLHEPVENLSRGQQQKVAVARALVARPKLLLLDEPTTGLDPGSRRQVQEFLGRRNREEGLTALITTHDMQEAQRLCHRAAVMSKGRIAAIGSPAELCRRTGTSNLEEAFLALTGERPDEEERPAV